jgi:uncharacterized protein involved in exopolysaccharide biosynthesis
MSEDEYRELKAKHDEHVRAASEARGAKKGLEDRIRKEFKLPDLKAAKAKLKSLAGDVARLEGELDELKTAYEEEFPSEA